MYITLCGKKREETERERKRERDWEIRVSHGCPLQLKCPQTSNLSQSHPKCWLSGACSDFDLGSAEKFPNFFWVRWWGGRHLSSIFNQTLTAFTDFSTWLCDCSISITSSFVIHQETLFDFHIPPAPSVYAPLLGAYIYVSLRASSILLRMLSSCGRCENCSQFVKSIERKIKA